LEHETADCTATMDKRLKLFQNKQRQLE
jgi:hypothetical protein